LLTGNFFSENVNIGRNDAGNGLLLFGDGKGNFKPCPVQQSGFLTPLDAKALTSIYVPAKGKMVMLITNNNAIVQAFAWNRNLQGFGIPFPVFINDTDSPRCEERVC